MLTAPPPAVSGRRKWWPLLKWTLCAIILGAVAWQAWKLWRQVQLHDAVIQPGWLALAAAAYVIGWIPAVWYWRRLLAGMGEQVGWLAALRAYYCGHLGKYVPGKAGVVLIRAGMLRSAGVRTSSAAITAGYETLVSMGAGAAVGVGMIPWVIPGPTLKAWIGDTVNLRTLQIGLPVVVLAGCLLGLPLISRILNLLLGRLLPLFGSGAGGPASLALRTSPLEFLLLICGWWLHGLSLGFTIQSISTAALDWGDWPRWTAGTALATVLGFVAVFAPGGMGVREGVLMEIFGAELGFRAVLAAGLLRIVWLAGETGAAAGLYYAVPAPRKDLPL